MPSPFSLPPTLQQEEFSRAYIAAVASAAGYSSERRVVDVDHIDIDIRQRSDDTQAPFIDCLSVQAKCTYHHSPQDGALHFPLDAPTHNSLCQRRLCPRILVVVHVPRDVADWLTHDDDCMILRHSAYWLSLIGGTPTERDSCTVRIPLGQRFTVTWLRKTMDNLAKDGHL